MVTVPTQKDVIIKKHSGGTSGFVALLTIVVVAAATLIMAFNSSLLGIGELELSFAREQGNAAFFLSEGCMEESLRRLRLDGGFTGETLTLDTGTCILTITISGNYGTSTVAANTPDGYYQTLESAFTITGGTRPVITILSWQERS